MALYQGSAGMDEYYGKICEYTSSSAVKNLPAMKETQV